MIEKKWNLAVVQKTTNALEVFTSDNVENLVREIEEEVRSIVCDVTTPKGRKEIASLAHKVSRSKTAMDSLGKDLVSDGESGDEVEKSDAYARLRGDEAITHRKILREKINWLNNEAEAATDRFNKGYFEGKAEMAQLLHDSLGFSEESDIRDVINGDV